MRDAGYTGDLASTDDTGSGLCLALLTALSNYSETGDPVPNGYVEGGMGSLTEAMATAVRAHGGVIRTATPVARILTAAGHARGVRLATGEAILADIVVSNADPKRTLLGLIDPEVVPPALRRRVAGLTTVSATCLKLHRALSEFPDYRLEPGLTEAQIRGATAIFCRGAAHREATKLEAKRGDLPTEPLVYSFIPSVHDPSLAPPGRYTWSAWIIPVPYRPREGSWSNRRAEAVDRIFRLMDRYAPNFSRSVIDHVLYTPEDLETRMLLTEGNIHHVDGMPSQLLWQRPLPELARYRTPVAGLYLCGAGMHPWGEITGAPGHNAAHAVLEDLPSSV